MSASQSWWILTITLHLVINYTKNDGNSIYVTFAKCSYFLFIMFLLKLINMTISNLKVNYLFLFYTTGHKKTWNGFSFSN